MRRHSLLFNVSLPHHEHVTAAELRLYTLVQNDRHLYAGVDRKVTIYEVSAGGGDHNRTAENGEGSERTLELASRQVFGTDDGWQTFDLSAAAERWRGSDGGPTHRLEVHIASTNRKDAAQDKKDGDAAESGMEIETGVEDKHKPLLIVFSEDQSGDRRDDKRELSEMIEHETANALFPNELWGQLGREAEEGADEPDEEDLIQSRSNFIDDSASRIRRNAKVNHCKKQSLYVEFKDIGWDSWILAPTGYDAFECSGICSFPLTKHVTPTKHAIVQTLVNINSPQKAARACCVPTKLEPISLLYLDDSGVVTYKYRFEGMVVAECGCR